MNAPHAHAAPKRIRVLLVDDSPLAIEIIRRMLATAPEIEVVHAASHGREALALVPQLKPDVVCTDLHMPVMDGLTLTRELMRLWPVPILVMSTSLQEAQRSNIFALLDAGALDVLAKPLGGLAQDFGVMAHELVRKIRILSGVKVFKRAHGAPGRVSVPLRPDQVSVSQPLRIVGIGASTGGPKALETILRALPRNFPLPLVCVQHIARGFMSGLVSWLDASCEIRVMQAQVGMKPQPGTAYFGVDDRHLEIDPNGVFRCSDAMLMGGHRPSVDLCLSSLARHYGAQAAGVLLTGMGHDGAQGLLELARAGGFTIAQDEASSVVFGMPKRAIELQAARAVLPLSQIAEALLRLSGMETP